MHHFQTEKDKKLIIYFTYVNKMYNLHNLVPKH